MGLALGEAEPETPHVVNIASLILSIVDGAQDAAHPVTYEGPSRALARVRVVALKRALGNLIDNAVRYGTSVHVILWEEDRVLRIWVDDEGPGIPEGDLAAVFEPFRRLEASRNRGTGGTGLGLTIARQAIEREGGSVVLLNRPEGGLRAEVELPRHVFIAWILPVAVAVWAARRGRTRWTIEILAVSNLLLFSAYVRHGWVP